MLGATDQEHGANKGCARHSEGEDEGGTAQLPTAPGLGVEVRGLAVLAELFSDPPPS